MQTWKARDFSLGYLAFEARRSRLSNAQIVRNATPAPASTSSTATFASIEAPQFSELVVQMTMQVLVDTSQGGAKRGGITSGTAT